MSKAKFCSISSVVLNRKSVIVWIEYLLSVIENEAHDVELEQLSVVECVDFLLHVFLEYIEFDRFQFRQLAVKEYLIDNFDQVLFCQGLFLGSTE